jgi:hypothetical protein
MPELDPFDTRLEAGIHAYADRALTSVDAAATAERAMRRRRTGPLTWLGVTVPVPVSILIVLALLLLALALSFGAGAPWSHQGSVLPITLASPTAAAPAATPPATPAPTATTDPATDGQGDEVLAGTMTLVLATPYSETRAGAVTRLRDGVITTAAQMSDPRVSGTGTWQVSADVYSTTGPRWGAYRLVNTGGAWDGTCSGSIGAGSTGEGAAWYCWLTGSGDYDGYSYHLSATSSDPGSADVRGVIVPASPPVP